MIYTYDQEAAIMHNHFLSFLVKVEVHDPKVVMTALAMLENDVDRTTWHMLRDLIEYIREHGTD